MLLVFIAIGLCSCVIAENPEVSTNELPCLVFGGLCVHAEECPDGYLAEVKGLCPLQQKSGVECCYAVPKSQTQCGAKGGECFPKSYRCPEILTYKEATDCFNDEKCCILVK